MRDGIQRGCVLGLPPVFSFAFRWLFCGFLGLLAFSWGFCFSFCPFWACPPGPGPSSCWWVFLVFSPLGSPWALWPLLLALWPSLLFFWACGPVSVFSGVPWGLWLFLVLPGPFLALFWLFWGALLCFSGLFVCLWALSVVGLVLPVLPWGLPVPWACSPWRGWFCGSGFLLLLGRLLAGWLLLA